MTIETYTAIPESFDEQALFQKAEEAAKKGDSQTVRTALKDYDRIVDGFYKLKEALEREPENPDLKSILEQVNRFVGNDEMDRKWRDYLPWLLCRTAMKGLRHSGHLVHEGEVRHDLADAAVENVKNLHKEFGIPFERETAYGLVYRAMLRQARNILVEAVKHGDYGFIEQFEHDVAPKLLKRVFKRGDVLIYALQEADALKELLPLYKADAYAVHADSIANRLVEGVRGKNFFTTDLMESLEETVEKANKGRKEKVTIAEELYQSAVVVLLRTLNEAPITEAYIGNFPKWITNVQRYIGKADYSPEQKLQVNGLVGKLIEKFPETVRKYQGLLRGQVERAMDLGNRNEFRQAMNAFRTFTARFCNGNGRINLDELDERLEFEFYNRALEILLDQDWLYKRTKQAATSADRGEFEFRVKELLDFALKYQGHPVLENCMSEAMSHIGKMAEVLLQNEKNKVMSA